MHSFWGISSIKMIERINKMKLHVEIHVWLVRPHRSIQDVVNTDSVLTVVSAAGHSPPALLPQVWLLLIRKASLGLGTSQGLEVLMWLLQ